MSRRAERTEAEQVLRKIIIALVYLLILTVMGFVVARSLGRGCQFLP